MSSKWNKAVTVTLNVGKPGEPGFKQYEADVRIYWYRELYGQDADGNRGVMMTFYEQFELYELRDITGNTITAIAESDISRDLEDRLDNACSEYEDDSQDEPDYDKTY